MTLTAASPPPANTDAQAIIAHALAQLEANNPHQTDGKWLEQITVSAAPHLKDWDIDQAWGWGDWPERESRYPGVTQRDIGIDVVALRSDGRHIAIQCKSRQLDAKGRGGDIRKPEIDKFGNASANAFWAELWLVTNGDNRMSDEAAQVISTHDRERRIKLINIHTALTDQQRATPTPEPCPHCETAAAPDADTADAPDADAVPPRRTKQCMQDEAVSESVRILREHVQSNSDDIPVGEARGQLILPCGTGKTRISLRIVEELTPPGELAIVLCPSIALVAQIRREYLQHRAAAIRVLAVCSDESAGYDPKKESSRNTAADPTLDNSNVSAAEIKGKVTTDPAEIADWMQQGRSAPKVSVIFGTYQSGHRIAEALRQTGITAQVMIADEAHRTAGPRRRRKDDDNAKLRDFALCHNNEQFPAVYRLYQTATPRIYDTSKVDWSKAGDWIVHTMDDKKTFGVELYTKSYKEAVNNGWLADYRIIAVAVNGPDELRLANQLAGQTESKGRQSLTTPHFLRGLAFALAMGGAARGAEDEPLPIKSCIAFMNTVDKSKNMAKDLQTAAVRGWLQERLNNDGRGQTAAAYQLDHLDATSKVAARENAKDLLGLADAAKPHGIINVGIFGEGTDAPSLSAVAFLEPRKSPVDVVQAVGRAMRTAPGKEFGYIICPIVIPHNADPETWLSTSGPEDGWRELGQILLALRAHDTRITDELAGLMQLYLPKPPEIETSMVAIVTGEEQRISHWIHIGPHGAVEQAIVQALDGQIAPEQVFQPLSETQTPPSPPEPPPSGGEAAETHGSYSPASEGEPGSINEAQSDYAAQTAVAPQPEPIQIFSGKKHSDGSNELRLDTVEREKSGVDGVPGKVNYEKTKAKGRKMINEGEGLRINPDDRARRRTREEVAEQSALRLLKLTADGANAITMNVLAKSGLTNNRVMRDLNLLKESVGVAAYHLREDELLPALNRHFGLDNLKAESLAKQADGCTIAALLLMNAAMLHQRIANGRWLPGIGSLDEIKNAAHPVRLILRQWRAIIVHDFRPVLEPAINAIDAIEDTGKLAGLERALHHIAAEAARIAETYADMGADHAGPLFNKVMGNQASDGAFFTRPPAASLAARLTLDACESPPFAKGGLGGLPAPDWTSEAVWRQHKTVDLACGSGTLLAAILTEMKRRARKQGASEFQIGRLQQLAVEDTIKGMDINPVSLQLAASQLTAGNQNISYQRMGLHLMPYGPSPATPAAAAGTLELLGQQAIVSRTGEMAFVDDPIQSQTVWQEAQNPELRGPVEAAQDARIVIMNPPFSNRTKMGEKFPQETQRALRARVDEMERLLVRNDPDLANFVNKNTLGTMFTALADKCVPNTAGSVMTMIRATIALCATSGLEERIIMAQRWHIHTVVTSHHPQNINLAENSNINQSIIVATRPDGSNSLTRFINLDRMPANDAEADELHQCLAVCDQGAIANGWGEVSWWPAERIAAGDWTPAVWRSPELAEASARFANDSSLYTIEASGLSPAATGQMLRGSFEPAAYGLPGSFPILSSTGADAQTCIEGRPDEDWIPKKRDENIRQANGGSYPQVDQMQKKAGHLLITARQRNNTSRVTATANDTAYVGNGWMPVGGLAPDEAKALAVFINSTPGRLQLMRTPGQTLEFPTYSTAEAAKIRIPDVKDARIRQILAGCWEETRGMEVPQFRDGECGVRQQWDAAVAKALGWDGDELTRLRQLLHREPHVRGLGYNQHPDAVEG